jgi:rhamnose transport system permease protein
VSQAVVRRAARGFVSWEAFLAVLCLVTIVFAALLVPGFATPTNLSQAASTMAEKGLLVLPMAVLIICREIDLSVASQLALSSVVFGLLIQAGVPLVACIPLVILVGLATGAFNGLFAVRLGLPALVVTLGTLALYRGLGYVLLGTASVNELPASLTDFGVLNVPGTAVPWTIVPFLVSLPFFVVMLHGTATGRRIYAIGGGPDVARFSGVRVARIRGSLFVVTGLMAAIAGMVYTARLSNARADNALGYELDVITICFLGGISFLGGRGRLTGVVFALVLVTLVRNVLGLKGVGGDAQGIVVGMLLIVSILATNLVTRLSRTLESRRSLSRLQTVVGP